MICSFTPPEMVTKPEDVVEASLCGLRKGETVCIPALTDPGLPARLCLWESERQVLEQSAAGTLAKRYRE